jgi:hypothetical protein
METLGNLVNQLRPRPESAEEIEAREARKRAVIEKLAHAIVRRGLAAPAVLLFEVNRPLGFIYSQVTHFAHPFLSFFLPPQEVRAAAEVMDDAKSMEALLDRITELSDERERARG